MRLSLLLVLSLALGLVEMPLHAQWQMQDAHTTADLRGIDAVGNGVAWASGTHGTVLRTEDAGFVWQLCTVPPGAEHLDFRGIQAFDNNTAIVMSSGKGDLSRLYKTTDGCQTWKLLFTNPDKDGFWDALRIDSARAVFLLGDPVKAKSVLFDSFDAGATWQRINLPKVETYSEEIFAASNSALVVSRSPHQHVGLELVFATGGDRSALHTIQVFDRQLLLTGGNLLSSEVFARLPSGATAGIFSIALRKNLDDEVLLAVGGDYKKTDAIEQNAARCEWQNDALSSRFSCENSATQPHGYRSAVAYDKAHNAWITVGPNGTDVSADDGRNWRALKPGPEDAPDADQHWNALSLPFVVGPHGRIGMLRAEALAVRP